MEKNAVTSPVLTADDLVRFLRQQPDFLAEHPELLADLKLPSPHGGRAISLQERQMEVLREKLRQTERRLAELLRVGEENDAIGQRLATWTRSLLLTAEPERLPGAVVEGLASGFSVPQVALRLWGVREPFRGLPFTEPVSVELIERANELKMPFCGLANGQSAVSLLAANGGQTGSVALIALRKGVDPHAFGLLVLGSADPGRFDAGMGTAFLQRISEIASAALSRLIQ